MLDAAEEALGDRPLSVLTTAGELVTVEEARSRPWDVAAANWVATALAVAGEHPDALLIDVGSTTTDVVPIAGGRVAATGYTTSSGCWRASSSTPACCAPTSRRSPRACRSAAAGARWRRSTSRSAATSISSSAELTTEAYDCPTPDGRPATAAFARERIARLVCSDVEQLDAGEVDAIAAYLAGEQLRQIEDAARRVGRALTPEAPVVAAGSGAFLGREVASRLGRAVAPAPWGEELGPAAALAALLAARC